MHKCQSVGFEECSCFNYGDPYNDGHSVTIENNHWI